MEEGRTPLQQFSTAHAESTRLARKCYANKEVLNAYDFMCSVILTLAPSVRTLPATSAQVPYLEVEEDDLSWEASSAYAAWTNLATSIEAVQEWLVKAEESFKGVKSLHKEWIMKPHIGNRRRALTINRQKLSSSYRLLTYFKARHLQVQSELQQALDTFASSQFQRQFSMILSIVHSCKMSTFQQVCFYFGLDCKACEECSLTDCYVVR
jgi:hypothetical protein